MILPTFRSIHIMKSLYLHYYPLHIHPHRLFHSTSIALFSSPISARNRPVFPFSHPLSVHRKASKLPSIRSHASMPPEGSDPSPMEVRPLFGEIHVIIGPMFAGKTTALIRRLQLAIDGGRKVAMVKSDKDTRYGLDSVVSHDGVKMPCFALQELSVLRSKIGDDAYAMLDVIGIDEAQFFEDIYDFCRIAADHDGKTVIVAGLDGDYLRKSFGAVLDIIPLADSVTKLTSKCEICRRPAFFTLRKSDETETEVIGGADLYMPVCRRHYVDGQLVIETTRYLLETQKTVCEPCYEAEPVSRF